MDEYPWNFDAGYDSNNNGNNQEGGNSGFDSNLAALLTAHNAGYDTDQTMTSGMQNFATPQQPLPTFQQSASASRAPSTAAANPTYSFRSDLGWFVAVPYPTFSFDPEIGYYNLVPAPEAAAIYSPAPFGQSASGSATAPAAHMYSEPSNGNAYSNTPYGSGTGFSSGNFDDIPMDDSYTPDHAASGSRKHRPSFPRQPATPRKRTNRFPKSKPAPTARRNAVHKNSIVAKCGCSAAEHIPRPANAFIVFRSQGKFPEDIRALMTNEERVRMIGGHKLAIQQASRLWNILSERQQQRYNKEAEKLKKEHARKYPNYKYMPKDDLARDFGNETCTCGAYQINLDARRQRAKRNSQDDGSEARPKTFGSRRPASNKDNAFQVDLENDAESDSELSDPDDLFVSPDNSYEPTTMSKKMRLSAEQRASASAEFDEMVSRASAERQDPSRRPARATKQPVYYGESTPAQPFTARDPTPETFASLYNDMSNIDDVDFGFFDQFSNGAGMEDDGLFVEGGTRTSAEKRSRRASSKVSPRSSGERARSSMERSGRRPGLVLPVRR
ncbi:putative High mobility group box domain-containing protein [Septoria linicola]|nr:putative High mobility group box domain-containing protein [Septoria linicola]